MAGGFLSEVNAVALCRQDGPSKAVTSDYDDLKLRMVQDFKGGVRKSGELSMDYDWSCDGDLARSVPVCIFVLSRSIVLWLSMAVG